ncbi:MAG: ribonuclease P protein component [Chitinophagaceae bacterium]
MTRKLTLGKKERLKSRKAIEQLFKEGRRFTVLSFRVFYLITAGTGLKFGTGVGTRNFKKAVDRNRIKRLSREAWRLQKSSLQKELEDKKAGLHIFLIYTGKEMVEYRFVFENLTTIINKLAELVHENNTPHS